MRLDITANVTSNGWYEVSILRDGECLTTMRASLSTSDYNCNFGTRFVNAIQNFNPQQSGDLVLIETEGEPEITSFIIQASLVKEDEVIVHLWMMEHDEEERDGIHLNNPRVQQLLMDAFRAERYEIPYHPWRHAGIQRLEWLKHYESLPDSIPTSSHLELVDRQPIPIRLSLADLKDACSRVDLTCEVGIYDRYRDNGDDDDGDEDDHDEDGNRIYG